MAKASELRNRSLEELRDELSERKEQLFRLRFQNATHQLDNYAQIQIVKRDVARILTVLTEKLDAESFAGEDDQAVEPEAGS